MCITRLDSKLSNLPRQSWTVSKIGSRSDLTARFLFCVTGEPKRSLFPPSSFAPPTATLSACLFFSEHLPNFFSFDPPFPYPLVISDLILAFWSLDVYRPTLGEVSADTFNYPTYNTSVNHLLPLPKHFAVLADAEALLRSVCGVVPLITINLLWAAGMHERGFPSPSNHTKNLRSPIPVVGYRGEGNVKPVNIDPR